MSLSFATARQYLAQIQDLIERFGVLFPRWPSLADARQSATIAARNLDRWEATPPENNQQPAATAINRPYSFLFYMSQTATATDPELLQQPEWKIVPPPETSVPETIAYIRSQIERIERLRQSPTPQPTPPPPLASPSGSPSVASGGTSQSPAAAAAIASPVTASTQSRPPAYATTGGGSWSSGGGGGAVLRSGVSMLAEPTDATPAPAAPSPAASRTNPMVWVALAAAGLFVFVGGKKKGARR
jgi:hypothetical protein